MYALWFSHFKDVFMNYCCGNCLRCFRLGFPFWLVVTACGFVSHYKFDAYEGLWLSNKVRADSVQGFNLFFHLTLSWKYILKTFKNILKYTALGFPKGSECVSAFGKSICNLFHNVLPLINNISFITTPLLINTGRTPSGLRGDKLSVSSETHFFFQSIIL